MRVFSRQMYLDRLISAMGFDQVKIVTGVRRCGKTYLLFDIFKNYLLTQGVEASHIIEMSFDTFENRGFRSPDAFWQWVQTRIGCEGKYYVLLDEVQLLDAFVEILNGLIRMPNVDVYVTGSNARFLSRDIATEFRGRGEEIHMRPLSFREFMEGVSIDKRDAYEEYITYGGLPAVVQRDSPEAKADYLSGVFEETYLRDLVERNDIRNPSQIATLVDVLSSNIGSLTNALKLSNTFKSECREVISPATVDRYLTYLTDAFLFEKASRYDIKGRGYIGAAAKYYAADLGLRNARLKFRQREETHLMENAVYNELRDRGWFVDVGVVPIRRRDKNGSYERVQLECDFVCNKGDKRIYIQSAYALPTEQKWEQEQASLRRIDDSFKKVIVTKEGGRPYYNEHGVLVLNVFDFLLDENALDI